MGMESLVASLVEPVKETKDGAEDQREEFGVCGGCEV